MKCDIKFKYRLAESYKSLQLLVSLRFSTSRYDVYCKIWVKSEGSEGSIGRESNFAGYRWQELEKDYIIYLLEENRWNVTRASQKAGVKRSTFDSRMRKLGIKKTT